MAPVPADSSVCCETGGAGAATQLSYLEADQVSWPSDAEMTVLRVKARGQSILGDGGHLCWPSAVPRVMPPIPPSGAVISDDTGSLVNLAAPSPDAAPDGEALLVPLSSWSARSINLSDVVSLPPQSPGLSPRVSLRSSPRHETAVEAYHLQQVELRATSTQADFSRPDSPQPRSWRDFFTNFCCGGGSDSS